MPVSNNSRDVINGYFVLKGGDEKIKKKLNASDRSAKYVAFGGTIYRTLDSVRRCF